MPKNQLIKPFDDEILDVKKQSLYARLKRLFSTDVIVRNVGGKQLKIKDTDSIMYATDRNSLRDRFNRIRSTAYNAYSRDFALSYQAARMDLFRDYDCVGPDTIIPLPDGTRPTIGELAEKYKDKPQERFYVYSYDHKTDSIKLGKAFHPRKKGGGTREGFKVTFDNGQFVIGSIKHPFLMRNGEYKKIVDLKVGESVMPFNVEWKLINDYDYKFLRGLIDESVNTYKIISIESIGPLEVYDVTVEEYHNFATDSCIVKNTMDMDPIISSACDIYADECLTYNEMGKMLTIHSNNNNVKQILENLFTDILNIQFNLWSWTRNMCKYGDFFLKLYVTPEYGVYMVEPISAYNVERIENADPYNKRYVKFQLRPTDTAQAEILENYEMAHFRLMSDSNFLPYGKSMIEGGRRVWKQLSLMEDAMLIHRIMRAPEKRIFYTDIGNIPPAEVDNYMSKMMDKMKKVPYMDEQSGEYNLRFNLQNMVEDYYIPVRGGDSGTRIDTLGGMEWTGTEDIEYLRNKLMAALKIPKPFLGYDESTSGKSTLASEDVRFARTIQRIQRIICSELTKIAIVHLYAQGYRDESLVDFELELTNPSTIFEKEKIEIFADKVSVATDMVENKFFSFNWIYKNIFNMSDDDIKIVRDEVVEDAKQRFRFTSIEEDGDDPAKPFSKIGSGGGGKGGDGGGGLGGGGGGGGGGGMPDFGDLEGGPEGEGPEGEGGPEDGLEGEGGPEGEGEEGDENPEDKKKKPGEEDIEDLVKEVQLKRDQSGEHDARRDHPMSEDPLGDDAMDPDHKKNSEGKKKSAITHNYEGGSPLRLREQKTKPQVKRVDSALFTSL